MLKKTISVVSVCFFFCAVSFFGVSVNNAVGDVLTDLKKQAVESDTVDNSVKMPNRQKYIDNSSNVIEKRCRENNLSEMDCKRAVRQYEINKYVEQRYLAPNVGSQSHFE